MEPENSQLLHNYVRVFELTKVSIIHDSNKKQTL